MVKQSPDQKPAAAAASASASASAAESSGGSSSSSCKYKGVRKRKWGKWVSEIRLPNSRERIWLGSYDTAEKAARAFDAALFCLRGRSARFNFPNSPPDIAGGRSLSHAEIQAAATCFANSAPSSTPSTVPVQAHSEESDRCPSPSPSMSDGTIQMDSDFNFDALNGSYWDVLTDNNNNNNSNTTNNRNFMEFDSYYPSDYGIFPGFDDLSNDFYMPTMPPPDQGDDNFDGALAQEPFLWNF